jgi:hypothetical protein
MGISPYAPRQIPGASRFIFVVRVGFISRRRVRDAVSISNNNEGVSLKN